MFESDFVDWHIAKGFDPKPSRTAAHLILTSLKPNRKSPMRMNSHTFQYNPKINGYDVSQLCLEAPDGTSVFQTQFERDTATEHYVKLMHKHQSNLVSLQQLPQCLSEIPEQEPVNKNSTCAVCGVRFYNYFEHVKCSSHKKKMKRHQVEYESIDVLCKELNDKFQEMCLKPKSPKKVTIDPDTEKKEAEKSKIKRKVKEQSKEEQLQIQLSLDRPVVMEIETQSQPLHKLMGQHSSLLDHSQTKHSNDLRK
jgi:hypothetical protein